MIDLDYERATDGAPAPADARDAKWMVSQICTELFCHKELGIPDAVTISRVDGITRKHDPGPFDKSLFCPQCDWAKPCNCENVRPTESESDAIDAATALAMLITALEHPGPLALDVLHGVSPRAASWVERGLVWVEARRTHWAWLVSFGRPR